MKRTLVVGFGPIGRGIHSLGKPNFVFGYPHAPRSPGFLPMAFPDKRALFFDRVIIASRYAPLADFLEMYDGDLVLVSSKAVYEDTEYGRLCARREGECLAAKHLRSLRIWRVGYAFDEHDDRLLRRIAEGIATPSEQIVEPLPASEVASVIVGDIAGPSMTVREVIESTRGCVCSVSSSSETQSRSDSSSVLRVLGLVLSPRTRTYH